MIDAGAPRPEYVIWPPRGLAADRWIAQWYAPPVNLRTEWRVPVPAAVRARADCGPAPRPVRTRYALRSAGPGSPAGRPAPPAAGDSPSAALPQRWRRPAAARWRDLRRGSPPRRGSAPRWARA